MLLFLLLAKKIMAVFLFDEIIFGPVKSRRLGVSLGINLLPLDYKYCNFDCIYCECGRTYKDKFTNKKFHDKEVVKKKLEEVLTKMKKENNPPDVITFAGNGEPTIHPDFEEIIDNTIELRNKYSPKSKIAVLSNATLIHKKKVFNALNKIDENILKLDGASTKTIKLLNNPAANFTIEKLIANLKTFNDNLSIQTMFLSGNYNGKSVDNTSDEEINNWIKILKTINPKKVMIYTIDRDTPEKELKKVSPKKLNSIAKKVKGEGFEVSVSL